MLPKHTRELMTIAQVPWWERLIWYIGFFLVMSLIFIWLLAVVALITAGDILTSLLPKSWRPTKHEQPIPEPEGTALCPLCQSPLDTEPVTGRTQHGKCPHCQRAFMREYCFLMYDAKWSNWQEDKVTDTISKS